MIYGTGEIVPLDPTMIIQILITVPITSSFDMANYTGMETNNYTAPANNGQPIFIIAALYTRLC